LAAAGLRMGLVDAAARMRFVALRMTAAALRLHAGRQLRCRLLAMEAAVTLSFGHYAKAVFMFAFRFGLIDDHARSP